MRRSIVKLTAAALFGIIAAGCGQTAVPAAESGGENMLAETSPVFSYSGESEHTLDELREKYPEYFELGTFKGIEVYVWQMAEGCYRCGAMTGTDANKSKEALFRIECSSVSVDDMKLILSAYDIPADEIFVIPYVSMLSSYGCGITDEYCERLEEMFPGCSVADPHYVYDNVVGYRYTISAGETTFSEPVLPPH